jgi:hypothetical protein
MERALRDIGRVYDGRVVWGRELLALDVQGTDVRARR